jgi:hypothetical protein
MSNSITVAGNVVRQRGELFSLNDLHSAAGGEDRHVPYRFIRLDQTQELIQELGRENANVISDPLDAAPDVHCPDVSSYTSYVEVINGRGRDEETA